MPPTINRVSQRRRTAALLAAAVVATELPPTAGLFAQVFDDHRRDVVVASGDTTPDGDGAFSTFNGPILNNAGTVVFGSSLFDSANTFNYAGVFTWQAGGLSTNLRSGEPSPDGNGRSRRR